MSDDEAMAGLTTAVKPKHGMKRPDRCPRHDLRTAGEVAAGDRLSRKSTDRMQGGDGMQAEAETEEAAHGQHLEQAVRLVAKEVVVPRDVAWSHAQRVNISTCTGGNLSIMR